MLHQLNFNDIPPAPPTGGARRTDPETSHEAARSVDVARLEALVLDALKTKPMTTKELARYLDIHRVSVSPRIAPLRNKGLVRDSGVRREKCAVWEAVSI